MKKIIQIAGLALSLMLPVLVTSCAGDRYERSTGEYIDDKTITMRVNSALGDNADYKFDDVKVTTFKGVVQLSGFVVTAEQRNRAEEIARRVNGVKDVENQISLKR